MIDWQKFPLRDVREILLRDFNTGKKIFDGDINSVVPRAQKSDDEKISRTRSIAEVFTPPEVVKQMVDALELEKLFWQARVECRCLEAACGEAPFITTRYDAESGEEIPAGERVGILDRKFQAIPENQGDKNFFATQALQSCYGYELQGDSLLIARANVLLSFAEFVEDFSADEIRDVAEIIAKNFWLMDGLKIPDAQANLFDANEIKITDWFADEKKYFFTGGNEMKFDVLISNPPYNEETADTSDKPVYHHFMSESAFNAAEKVVLITPARFLFDAGKTPKDFNRRMLNDPHFKVLHYEPNAGKLFRNAVDIKGGVAVTLHDTTKNFGAIGTFIPWDEMKSVHQKVCVDKKIFRSLSEIIYPPESFHFTRKFHEDNPRAAKLLSDGHADDLTTNVFDRLTKYFFDDKPDDGNAYIQIFGLQRMRRVFKWIRRDYVRNETNLDKFKVILPKSNGSGALGEVLSTPLVGLPLVGCTQTFITIGAFDTRDEAENCLAYIKSKFARAMLGILKATQHNPPATWAKVPLQDFSAASDIDWRGDVDGQLYRKYNLSDAEINFIDSHVKAMP